MTSPKVSVIVPAYNQSQFLGAAVESVLAQTYENFELIIVNDASPDDVETVVQRYDDPRIRCLKHTENRGLPAARNTGIRASTGEIIALLDADDIFHRSKLEKHLAFLDSNPDVGVTYNARFELNYSALTIRELVRPPQSVDINDFVLGFPFAPSDMVLRREWLFRVNLFDETFVAFSEDLDLNCRLALAGCRFACVDGTLNYRRHHSGRTVHNINARLDAALEALTKTFLDPRCPSKTLLLRNRAFAINYLVWGYLALVQHETELGQNYLRQVERLCPTMTRGPISELISFFTKYSVADESVDHVALLRALFDQVPRELIQENVPYVWAVGRGFLIKAMRAIIWGRSELVEDYMAQAAEWGAKIDRGFLRGLTHDLISYSHEFGTDKTETMLANVTRALGELGKRSDIRWLRGSYAFNQAFRHYKCQRYEHVPPLLFRAIANDPSYLANRGALSLLLRSVGPRIWGA